MHGFWHLHLLLLVWCTCCAPEGLKHSVAQIWYLDDLADK